MTHGKWKKYFLYEDSVQTPEHHATWLVGVYKELRGKYPRRLREDFCGTFGIASEWVRRNKRNTAVGLDLDPEPLAYGRKHNLSKLNAGQKKRIEILRQNVLSVTTPKADLIAACNFSFYVFKQRESLVEYFRYALRSLKQDGILVLELAGGPGMVEPGRERKTVTARGGKRFTYVWDQQSFDPITHDARYAIHFRLSDGTQIRNAFTYNWRLWSIPEVREALKEAGFAESCVYWETEHDGRGTGEFTRSESGDNSYAWIAYVIGMKG